jgi:hypothetical protein
MRSSRGNAGVVVEIWGVRVCGLRLGLLLQLLVGFFYRERIGVSTVGFVTEIYGR